LSASHDFFAGTAGRTAPGGVFDYELERMPIAPVLAGARARGVADAFEMLGIAAILVAANGDVLFANERARALLIPHLTLVGERLSAADEANQGGLARMIEAAVAGQNAKASSVVLRREGVPTLRLHATPIVSEDDPFQLLRAVIVLDREDARAV
jgi:hypothetical protein